jgi:hypothetical protein
MDPEKAVFVIGSLVTVVAGILFVYVVLQLPAVMRQERVAATLTGPLWLMFGLFCIGAGLVVLSPFEAFLVPGALFVIGLGVFVCVRAWPAVRARK